MKLIFSYEMKLWQTFVSYIDELEFNGPAGKIEIIVKGENEIYDDEWQWENNSADVDILINDKQADSIDEIKAAMTGSVLDPKKCNFSWLYNTEKWSDRDIVKDLRNVVDERIELKALTIEDGEASWDIPKEAFEGILFGHCSDMIENYDDEDDYYEDWYYGDDDEDEEDDDDDEEECDEKEKNEMTTMDDIIAKVFELQQSKKFWEKKMIASSDDTETNGERVIKLTDDNVAYWADRVFGPDYDEEEDECGLTWSNYSEVPDNIVLDTSELTDFSGLFERWSNLEAAPDLDTSNGRNFNGMFQCCYRLNYVPKYDLSNATTARSMFEECDNIDCIPDMIIKPGTDCTDMFKYTAIDEDEIREFMDTIGGIY